MKVAVIGAGIVGVTTAWELVCDGHEVHVFERRDCVAAETSFANAGIVAPGYVTPWAGPGMPGKVLGYLLAEHAPVRLHATLGLATLRWLWRWWRACDAKAYAAHRGRLLRLAQASRQRLHQIAAELEIDYERANGVLVLLRDTRDTQLAQPALKLLADLGVDFQLVDAAQCRHIETGLSSETPLHAGIHLGDGEVGNCRAFAQALRIEAQRRGVRFHFNAEVVAIEPGPTPRLVQRASEPTGASAGAAERPSVQIDESFESTTGRSRVTQPPRGADDATRRPGGTFDAVVVCAALESRALLRRHGVKLPMIAVHGYSITAPLRSLEAFPEALPRSALMDERFKVAISRIGNRVRVAGSAEIGGAHSAFDARAIGTLYKVLHDWFPGTAMLDQALRWKGARPMLPDRPPIIGASGLPGVWLNVGHGSSGWALACGSARLLADAVGGLPNDDVAFVLGGGR